MAALTKGRNTKARSGDRIEIPVKAGAKIHAGSLVAVDAAGWAVPMSTATTLKGVGRAEAGADNTSGGNGALSVTVGRGIYLWANSAAADAITRADIEADCYGVDDQTVAKTNGAGTRSRAGKIYDVDAAGVWVKHS